MKFCETHKDGTIVAKKRGDDPAQCARGWFDVLRHEIYGDVDTFLPCVITNYTKTSFVKELIDLLLDAWGKDASELEALLCDSCERRRWDAVQAREVSELWATGGGR